MALSPQSFEIFRKFLHEKSGIIVTPDKTYLLDSRLTPICRKRELNGLDALADLLAKSSFDKALQTEIVEAMTTNETSFFRDTRPFTLFEEQILPYLKEKRGAGQVKIWCAACSSGQEPYSLSMLIKENAAKIPGLSFKIIGTDIDNSIVETAKAGKYSQFEVQRGLPITHLVKYFDQVEDGWQIKDELRNMVEYKTLNLLDDFTTQMGNLDIVFCRNVLIYFDKETKARILEKIHKALKPDGFVILGGAETVLGISDLFKPYADRGGCYIKADATHAVKAA